MTTLAKHHRDRCPRCGRLSVISRAAGRWCTWEHRTIDPAPVPKEAAARRRPRPPPSAADRATAARYYHRHAAERLKAARRLYRLKHWKEDTVPAVIVVHHEARCLSCDEPVPVGAQACWVSGVGVWHLDCPVPKNLPVYEREKEAQRRLGNA